MKYFCKDLTQLSQLGGKIVVYEAKTRKVFTASAFSLFWPAWSSFTSWNNCKIFPRNFIYLQTAEVGL